MILTIQGPDDEDGCVGCVGFMGFWIMFRWMDGLGRGEGRED